MLKKENREREGVERVDTPFFRKEIPLRFQSVFHIASNCIEKVSFQSVIDFHQSKCSKFYNPSRYCGMRKDRKRQIDRQIDIDRERGGERERQIRQTERVKECKNGIRPNSP